MNINSFARTLLLSTMLGCAAVYPELGTTIRSAKGDVQLDPPPPEGIKWISFKSATIPAQMRDGRSWQQVQGKLPDPYAKLIINDAEVFRTRPQSETLSPTWKDAPRGNFKVSPLDKMRVEVWDSNTISDKPIGVKDFRLTSDFLIGDQVRLDVGGGTEVIVAFEPAHAMFGVGLWYELRSETVFITRLLAGSPAERAGIEPGDEVVAIAGKQVTQMKTNAIRTAFNSIPKDGLPLVIRHADGRDVSLTLREGPIYPTFDQYGQID